jgi:Domain of Unknown Function with PDB structure (DUF3857)
MNLRSLKPVIMLFFACAQLSVLAQKQTTEHTWDPAIPHTVLADSLKREDAVMIYHNHYVLNDLGYLYKEQLHYKVKILTPKGLKENSVIRVTKNEAAHFVGLDARTIKPNGKVIDLSAGQIKQLDFMEDNDEGVTTDLRFAIPGVEVGDEVEVFIDYESSALPKGRDLLIQTNVFTLSARLILKFNREFHPDLITYNSMPEADYTEEMHYATYKWELKNIEGSNRQNYSSPKFELPYVSYMVRFEGYNIANDRLYRMYYYNYEDKNGSGREFDVKLMRLAGVSDTQSAYGKFVTIYQYICKNIKLIEELPLEDRQKKMDFYLEKKQIDYVRLHVLLRHIFDELNIPYYICIGRNKYKGFLDFNFIPPQAISSFFFSIKDESDNMHLIYPGYLTHYAIDEIAPYFRGTSSLFIGKPNMEGAFLDVLNRELVSLGGDVNYRLRNAKITFDPQSDSLKYKVKETLSGDMATLYKMNQAEEPEEKSNKELMITDKTEEKESIFPFLITKRHVESQPNFMQSVGNNTYAIPLGGLLDIRFSEVNPGKRVLSYFPLCMYKDVNSIVLIFDKDIDSENLAKLNRELTNDYASVKVVAERLDARTISITTEYDIKTLLMEPQAINLLKEVNKLVNETLNARLIVVLK